MQKSRIAYIAILPIYYDIVEIEKQPRTHLSVTWIKVFEIVQLATRLRFEPQSHF